MLSFSIIKSTNGENESIIFGSSKYSYKSKKLAEILNMHEIKMYKVEEDFSHSGKKYKSGYSYVVPKNQKKQRLLNAMFETRTTFTDSLFYDVSSLSLIHI